MKKKQGDVQLKDIDKKYKVLYETSSDALMTLNIPEADFKNPNKAAVRMFKTGTKKKFEALHPWDLSPKYQPDGELSTFKAERMIAIALKKGTHFFDWTHKRYRGETFPATVLLTRMQVNGTTIVQATVRDMTEYNKLYVEVEELKKTQEALLVKNYVFNNAYTANSIANIKGEIIEANPYFLKTWGYSHKKEVLGKRIPSFFLHQKDASKVILSIRTTGVWSGDFVAKRKDGSTFIAYGRATHVKNEAGKLIGYQSSVYDITEQKEITEQYTNYIEKAPRGIHTWELKPDGQLVLVGYNPSANQILGIDHKNLLGKTIEEAFIAYKTEQRIPNIYRNIVKTGKLWREEVPYNAGGIAGYFDVTAFRLSKNKMAASFEDISGRKMLETELLVNKANDEAILQSIGDGMYVTDRQGTIVMVNKAFEEALGFSESEVIGRDVNAIIVRQDEKGVAIPLTKNNLEEILAGNKVKSNSATTYYVRKDRTRFPVASVLSPIELDNEIIGAVEVFKDITHEKEVDKAKTEFIMLASHQLRTPLSIINWYTNLLHATKALSPLEKEYVSTIAESNKRMVELVNTLLNVSQIELGTYLTAPEPIALQSLTKTMLRELAQHIAKKKHSVTLQVKKNVPRIVFDPRLLRMVIENVVVNAINYTPPKGKIKISIVALAVGDQFGGRKTETKSIGFAIKDSGIGIPRGQQKSIFQKLFRADNVRNQNTSGTGLGLYLTRSILASNKGDIWFTSVENHGSTFFITLPLS